MKKLFFALAAVAVMASCSKESGFVPATNEDSNQVTFSAYVRTAISRGTIATADELQDFGVFAFYQENANGNKVAFNTHKFSTPDFMYNQKVHNYDMTPASSDASGNAIPAVLGSVWSYSPIKYWPNNKGDQLSFFAYAPYSDTKTWEDMGILTDANGTKMEVSFPIYNDVKDQIDYLWADPQVNKGNKSADGEETVASKISFTFKHITSQISLYVGVEQETTSGNATAWVITSGDASANATPNPTTITVQSIEFKGLNDKITYKYNLSTFTPTTENATGTQSIILTKDNGNFQNEISTSWTEAKFYELLAKEENKNHVEESGFMFLAPQENMNDVEVIFTYKVETTDEAHPANNSTIINTISKKWGEFAPAITELAQGSAYRLNFLIGMNTVDFTASETAWQTATTHQVNVPLNE